jgi:type II secretory pathway pseudopilin PulG
VVVGIIGVLISLLLPAVQKVRETSNLVRCQNNMKQLGLALLSYHNAQGCLPPGMVSSGSNVSDAEATGFTFLLPYLEQDNTFQVYHFDDPWWATSNYQAVGTPIKMFYCPSNRDKGVIDLQPIATQWSTTLPPVAASCDYVFCKGANGALNVDWMRVPEPARGIFGIRTSWKDESGLRISDIKDGTAYTFAMGEGTAGNPNYLVRDLTNPDQPVLDINGLVVPIDQSWGASGAGDPSHPYYGCVFGVTAQYGLLPNPRDEPMNRRPTTPSVFSGDPQGNNAAGNESVSGFRS